MSQRIITTGTSEPFEVFLDRSIGAIYVDKTASACQLASQRGSYLLTRPRRMGKSTMVSTLKYLFTHGTDGAEDFAWNGKWKDRYSYFVLNFAWNNYKIDSTDSFLKHFLEDIENYAKYFGVSIDTTLSIRKIFENFITESVNKLSDEQFLIAHPELTKKALPLCKTEFVLLIDEYDAPLNSNLDNQKVFEDFRELYRELFSTIKNLRFRFVFITGVSSYAQTSIFSGANQFENISLDYDYATCCGYTQSELTHFFAPELEKAQAISGLNRKELIERLRFNYDGYLFTCLDSIDKRLFSPVSVSTFLKKPKEGFKQYWSHTGAPSTFLIRLIDKCSKVITESFLKELYPRLIESTSKDDCEIVDYLKSYFLAFSLTVGIKDISLDSSNLIKVSTNDLIVTIDDVYDISYKSASAILFQAGYLSIKAVKDDIAYLGLANYEVAKTLADLLIDHVDSVTDSANIKSIYTYLHENSDSIFDCFYQGGEALASLINRILNTAPRELFNDKNLEAVVTYVITTPLCYAGIVAMREVEYVKGRADLVIKKPANNTDSNHEDVIIEFKIARSGDNILNKLTDGSEQIIDRNYGVTLLRAHPLRYCIVISNDIRGVGAISKVSENGTYETVYKAATLNKNGTAKGSKKPSTSSKSNRNTTSSRSSSNATTQSANTKSKSTTTKTPAGKASTGKKTTATKAPASKKAGSKSATASKNTATQAKTSTKRTLKA